MKKYHKIQTVFKRDQKTQFRTLLEGEYSTPEFEYLKNNIWRWKEKVNGTNIRIMWINGEIKFGGKTDNAQIPVFLYNRLNEIFKGKKKIFEEVFPDTDVCLYGEGYGAKIQKGGGNYISDGVDFVLFDIKIEDWWLKQIDIKDLAYKLDLKVVPEVGRGTLSEMIEFVKKGFNSQWGNFQAEGVVAAPLIELRKRSGGRIITKLKYKDFH